MFTTNDFSSMSQKLRSRESRKIANNTYLVRRDPETIAVKLHATDVVTYHSDGTVTLRSGGYETVTTKDRLNHFGPDGIRVYSDKRVWYVFSGDDRTPFVDGMRFDPLRMMKTTESLRSSAESSLSAAKRLDGQLSRFVKRLTPERLSEIVSEARKPMGMLGDCLICRVELSEITDKGRKAVCLTSGDSEHLRSHITEDYHHSALILCALKWAGYRDPAYVVSHHEIVSRTLRRYLRARLIVAPKAETASAR